ncbi:zinc-binding dehydrogenase, partial [Saccharothrix longispora]|uniref:zinc-binding dehydrogenase n=1 Tax=Saccharothrix longispora TaxID=33920 RepID=UPI0028FD6F2B
LAGGVEVVEVAGRRELVVGGVAHPLPVDLDDVAALALARYGVTAWHLLRTCAHLRRGESVVVHDAVGPVGALVVQLAVGFGAGRVIATAPTQARRRLAVRLGADAAVDPSAPDVRERLLAGGPVDVVVGGTVEDALAVLAPFGRLVGHGEPFAVDPVRLGSRAVAGFRLDDCLARPGMVAAALSELTGLTSAGRLRPGAGEQGTTLDDR